MRRAWGIAILGLGACGRIHFAAPSDGIAPDAVPDVTPTGLLHYWPCDEAPEGLAARDIVGGANATLSGQVAFIPGGHRGNALDSNTGFAGVSTPPDMFGLAQITISAWIRRAGLNQIEQVGQEDNAATQDNNLSIQFWNDGLVYFCNGKGGTGACGTTPLNDTAWHHAVLVFDGDQPTNATRMNGYLDGAPQVLDFTGGTISTRTPLLVRNWDLGAVSDNEGSDHGTIDEVRVYDHALSAAEIATLP